MKTKRTFWRWLLDFLITPALFLSRVSAKLEGAELIPDGAFLMVSNHVSAYDPIVLMHLLTKLRLIFVSKPENFRIPVAGFFMRKNGFLPIDREKPRNAIKTIYEAADLLKEAGSPIVIYPEGTRNKSPGDGLLPFHNGVFKIAKRAGAPVVVAVSEGTERVHDNWPWKRTKVKVRILAVLDREYVASHSDKEISEQARQLMESALKNRCGSDC